MISSNISVTQSEPASSGSQNGETPCETDQVIASHAPVAEASAVAISPAISQAVSPRTVENNKTETDGNQSCNQSGSEPKTLTPNCYKCKHRRSLSWSAHSECVNPLLNEKSRLLSMIVAVNGGDFPMGVTGDYHGIRQGWFMWPMNYDPIWLKSCYGFEDKSA